MAAKAFMCTANARTAHEYDLLDTALRPKATCGYRPTQWIQDLYPAANIDMLPGRAYNLPAPTYCPKCLAA